MGDSIGAAIGAGLVAYSSKDLLEKLLGPSIEYVGGEMLGLVRKANINVDAIFRGAARILGSSIEEPGAVNPRVLRDVMTDGAFAEDSLTREYYAGLLASARSQDGNDDRAVSYSSIIKTMSLYQVRLHYAYYSAVKNMLNGRNVELGDADDRKEAQIGVPWADVARVLGEPDVDASRVAVFGEPDHLRVLTAHAGEGLARHVLIAYYAAGSPSYLRAHDFELDVSGVCFRPSPSGVELYLWVHGLRDVPVSKFLRETLTIIPAEGAVQFENPQLAKLRSTTPKAKWR